jgi:hypothetical protein
LFFFLSVVLLVLTTSAAARRQLIVVSVPGGPHENYYKQILDGSLNPISAMFSEYSMKAAEGGDDFMILYPKGQADLLDDVSFHADTWFLPVDRALDLWMRDFTTTFPDLQMKFV